MGEYERSTGCDPGEAIRNYRRALTQWSIRIHNLLKLKGCIRLFYLNVWTIEALVAQKLSMTYPASPAGLWLRWSWVQIPSQGTGTGYVEQEFEDYLKCGRLEQGFLRVRCDTCHAEHLVAVSCYPQRETI